MYNNLSTKLLKKELELIEKYPELLEMGAITYDVNGMMGITDEGIDYINQQNIKKTN